MRERLLGTQDLSKELTDALAVLGLSPVEADYILTSLLGDDSPELHGCFAGQADEVVSQVLVLFLVKLFAAFAGFELLNQSTVSVEVKSFDGFLTLTSQKLINRDHSLVVLNEVVEGYRRFEADEAD